MLKRSGRGLDPLGVESTVDGECAVECPACPHPGKNLPVNWQDAPAAIRYIFWYGLILSRLGLTVGHVQMDIRARINY